MKTETKIKAVAMISGGLDSALAAWIIKDLGIEIYGIHFILPWGCSDESRAIDIARQINIPLKMIHLDQGFLTMLQKPRHGVGAAMNPCVDCRIYNLTKAREYMIKIKAEFVFTGEILGQRPMSQMRQSLGLIERRSGLSGRLLRPLCAKLLEPTIPEQEGKIDRDSLYDFSGRSRSKLQSMARALGIKNYTPTGGGCLLTDKNFSNRLKDSFLYGYANMQEILCLKWGRHFRFSPEHKAIVGRDDLENEKIFNYANNDDLIFWFSDQRPGPSVVLKGKNPPFNIIQTAAYLVKRFSKYKDNSFKVDFFQKQTPQDIESINPPEISEENIKLFKI